MDLGGTWLAIEANDEARRSYPDPGHDDRGWTPVRVPGQWRGEAGFADSDGPLLYRTRFDGPDPGDGAGPRRWWLTFEGIFYQADIWLDGAYLGDTEGYFAPHSFEVGAQLTARREHLLAVEVACPPAVPGDPRRILTGAFQDPGTVGPGGNPGGIWAPVRLTGTGPVRITSLRVLCREAGGTRAVLDLSAVLDSDTARTVAIDTVVAPAAGPDPVAESAESRNLAAGANVVRWRVVVERPALWWPRTLGPQPLHDVAVTVSADGAASDTRAVTTGLRQVRVRRSVTTVNDERLFLKGCGLGPTGPALSTVTAAAAAADIDAAAAAGLDLVTVTGHVGHPGLYDRADAVGMLVWQDLPIEWGDAPVRRQAVRQARRAVDLLGHHPSIARWCGHHEALGGGPPAGERPTSVLRRAARQALPHWNATRLDRSVRRAFERADASRPVVAHSGALPHPAWGTDTPLSPGWYDDENLAAVLAGWPALAHFVSGLGAPALPDDAAAVAGLEAWPEIDWDRLAASSGVTREQVERWVPPAGHDSLASWRDATQAHQAAVVTRAVLTLRRLKYRPTGGFALRILADARPGMGWSLLDADRLPKPAYAALAAACAPVVVVTDELPAPTLPGGRVDVGIHVVSDLRTALDGAEASALLEWPGGRRRWRFAGTVPADSCVRIGRILVDLPRHTPPGPLRLTVRLTWRGGAGDGGDGETGVVCVTPAANGRVELG